MTAVAPEAARLRRWRRVTLAALFIGYCGYYVCRSNLSVTAPLLLAEAGPAGLTKADLGWIASAGTIAYVVGKVLNGLLADSFGGRRLFLGGMAVSVAATLAFGAATGPAGFLAAWVVNRYAQSAGWGAVVQVAGRWFPAGSRATVMGVLSMSYLLGDAAAREYLGQVIGLGFGWRETFGIAAATLAVVAVGTALVLRGSPADVGLAAPTLEPSGAAPAVLPDDGPATMRERVGPLLRSPTFWVVCLLSGGMTLLRETFGLWSPVFLKDEAGLTAQEAARGSAVFPLVGAASALFAGVASDRWRGRRGPVIVAALVGLVGVLGVLAAVPVAGRPGLALGLLAAAAFLLTGPYSFCAGVMALDLGGKRGGATAAGLIDAAGYFGAVLSGAGVGAIAERAGWPAAFAALAGVAALTAGAGVAYWAGFEQRAGTGKGVPT